MDKLRKTFSKIPMRYLTIALVVVAIVSCIVASATFAVYHTTIIGTGETPVASWDFKVKIDGDFSKDDGIEDSLVIDVNLAGDDDYSWSQDVPDDLAVVNPDAEYSTLSTELQNAYSEIEVNGYKVQNHKYNRDANTQLPDYMLAPGTSGYMPVEIDGSQCCVSLIVTVSAYFGDLPDGFEFYDNLGNKLELKSATSFVPTSELNATNRKTGNEVHQADVASYSYISYQYYLSVQELDQWSRMSGDKFIDIGFRWTWIYKSGNQNYDVSHLYNEIRVTGEQITVASQANGKRAINFVSSATDINVTNENTLNILTAPLSDGTVIAPASQSFYLDVNKKYPSSDALITIKPEATNETAILGTNRTQVAYNGINKYTLAIENVKDSNPAEDIDAYISGDFTYQLANIKASNVNAMTLVSNMNEILDNNGYTDTMYEALKEIINKKTATDFAINFSTIDSIDSLSTLISTTSADDSEEILWSTYTKKFTYVKNGKEYAYDNIRLNDLSKKYTLFKVYDSYPTTDQTYSIYLAGSTISGAIDDLSVGLDVGNNQNITKITYTRPSDAVAQDVIINTNSFINTLEVDAITDIVRHYGVSASVYVKNVRLL